MNRDMKLYFNDFILVQSLYHMRSAEHSTVPAYIVINKCINIIIDLRIPSIKTRFDKLIMLRGDLFTCYIHINFLHKYYTILHATLAYNITNQQLHNPQSRQKHFTVIYK